MLKFFQTLNFRRSFLIIDTILQFLGLFLFLYLYFSTDKLGYGLLFICFYLLCYFGIQSVSIIFQSLIQFELKKVRLIYLISLLILVVFSLYLFQIPAVQDNVSNNSFADIFGLILLIFCIIFYPILSIYHCFLLFKKSN